MEHESLMKVVVIIIRVFLYGAWAYNRSEPVTNNWGIDVHNLDEFGMLNSDRRMFLELLYLLAKVKKSVNNALMEDVSKNKKKLTSPSVQREIGRICAQETINCILTSEVGDSNFSLILDGWKGTNGRQYVSLVIRFVSSTGAVIERFLGIVHVPEEHIDHVPFCISTIEEYLREKGVQLEKLRCYSYNGSSWLCEILRNLKGDFSEEHKWAYCIHCPSHRFQLTVVTEYSCQAYIFYQFIVGLRDFLKDMPVKLKDPLKKRKLAKIMKSVNIIYAAFTREEILYYNAIVSLITDYSQVIKLLEFTFFFGSSRDQKYKSYQLLKSADTFEFALSLHLMRDIVGLTNRMSQLLEKRENDIENAMSFVTVVNQKLGDLKDHGWDPLLREVSAFCKKNKIVVPDMASIYVAGASLREEGEKITNLQYYHDELFLSVVESVIQEINEQFPEPSETFIRCIAAMNPKDSFSSFNKNEIVSFAKLFPSDFSPEDIDKLEYELENYIIDMRFSLVLKDLDGIAELAQKLVTMQWVKKYPLVYRVIELALTLPIVAPAIERVVSSGEVVKEWVSKRVGNEWVNDCLVTYIEKDVFCLIEDEVIIDQLGKFLSKKRLHR